MGDRVPREMAVRVKRTSPDRTRLTDRWLGTSNPPCVRGGLLHSSLFRVLQMLDVLPHSVRHGVMKSPISFPKNPVPLMFSRFMLVGLFALGGSLGCASTPAPPRIPDPTFPREPERIPIPSTPINPPPAFVYRDGSYAYDLQQLTTVTVGGEGAPPAEDTLRTQAGLTYSISSVVGTSVVSATIDSLVITSGHDTVVRRLVTPVTVQLPASAPPLLTADDSLAFLSTCDSMEETARGLAGDIHI